MEHDVFPFERFSRIPRAEQGLGHVHIEKMHRTFIYFREPLRKIDGNLAFAAARFPQEDEIFATSNNVMDFLLQFSHSPSLGRIETRIMPLW
jgi:hypothetical protein